MNDPTTPPPDPPSLGAGIFESWRAPRRGVSNPQDLTNPLWCWLVTCRQTAYEANQQLSGPSSIEAGPMWCFHRFGQSTTSLSDGTEVFIGGEHEDHYDPDFWIYNDIVIRAPGQAPRILGYPVDSFPPTDFHSATLVGRRIVLIGNLGYPTDRRPGTTQVLFVSCDDWSTHPLPTSGTHPGWIHGHQAVLAPDGGSVLVRGGRLDRGHGFGLVENIDDWRLHLADARWERLTRRRWERYTVVRSDGLPHHLWELRQAAWAMQVKWPDRDKQLQNLTAALGAAPLLDVLPTLYRPALPHEALPDREDEHQVHRLRIDGLKVRMVETMHAIEVTVEGRLAPDVSLALRRHLADTFAQLENATARLDEIGD